MPEPSKRLPIIPNFKKEVVALFKSYGPHWMLAALVVVTLPLTLGGLGYCLKAVADLLRALHR